MGSLRSAHVCDTNGASRYADAQLFCNCNLALIEPLGKGDIKSYNSPEDVDKRMPEKGFGAGMYEEEDDAQHESGEREVVRMFRRAANPTARDVTPALGCDPVQGPPRCCFAGTSSLQHSCLLILVCTTRATGTGLLIFVRNQVNYYEFTQETETRDMEVDDSE